MSFKDQMVIRILLIIAKYFCDEDTELLKEISNLQTHISVYGKVVA